MVRVKSVSGMVTEVNKLIFNALISEGAVHLPEVGTIFVERKAAGMVTRNSVGVPSYAISFSNHRDARSIVDIIVQIADIEVSQAIDIYERWLDKVRRGNELTIDGVGALRNKSFIADNELLMQLNPQGINELAISRRRGSGVVVPIFMLAILLLCIGGGAYYYFTTHAVVGSQNEVLVASNDVVVEEVVAEVVAPELVVPDSLSDTVAEEAYVAENETIDYSNVLVGDIIEDWRTNTDIRHYVVVGSYSTEKNAERAINELSGKYNELLFNYFKLGSMYAVAAFGSTNREDCERFVCEYKQSFPQLWIHTPRKHKN